MLKNLYKIHRGRVYFTIYPSVRRKRTYIFRFCKWKTRKNVFIFEVFFPAFDANSKFYIALTITPAGLLSFTSHQIDTYKNRIYYLLYNDIVTMCFYLLFPLPFDILINWWFMVIFFVYVWMMCKCCTVYVRSTKHRHSQRNRWCKNSIEIFCGFMWYGVVHACVRYCFLFCFAH